MVAILIQLIFMTPNRTKLPNLLILECHYYTWLQFKENKSSFSAEEEAQSKHSSKWHSLTTTFTKLMMHKKLI